MKYHHVQCVEVAMGSAIPKQNVSLAQPAAEEALRNYVSGRSGFDYGLARDLEMLIAALRAAHHEAKAANQAKSEFLACVSHELRTPLNAIIGFADMIANQQLGPNSENRYADYAKDILKGAHRLSDILGDIIDMAQLESGRLKAQRDTVVFSDLIEEVRAILAKRNVLRSATLNVIVAPDFPETMWTDKSRMRQVLVSLLSNALAYSPPERAVSLSASLSTEGTAEIEIIDKGQGMSPADLKRAVTRFGHVEGEASRERPGIGLGLPLAKGLANLLGGQMTIESAPGAGTTVTLSFPINEIRSKGFEWGKPVDRTEVRTKRLLGEKSAKGFGDR
jgi:two-component system cell cycle sensor histidine kinase PleC